MSSKSLTMSGLLQPASRPRTTASPGSRSPPRNLGLKSPTGQDRSTGSLGWAQAAVEASKASKAGRSKSPGLEVSSLDKAFAAMSSSTVSVTSTASTSNSQGSASSIKENRYGEILGGGKYTHIQLCTRVCLNTEGRLLASAGGDGRVKLFAMPTAELVHDIDIDPMQAKRVSALSFNSDGKLVVVGDWGSNVYLYDVKMGQRTMQMLGHNGKKVTCGVFESKSKFLLTGGEDKRARMWDSRVKGGTSRDFDAPDEVLDCAFSPDSRHVLLALKTTNMELFDVRKETEVLLTYRSHEDWVNSCVFSPDGTNILSASQDKTVKLWDIQSRQVLASFGPLQESVNSAKFFGKNRIVAAQGNRFWQSTKNSCVVMDRKSKGVVMELEGHVDAVMCLDVNFRFKTIVTASMDKSVRIWEISDQDKKEQGDKDETSGKNSCKFGCGKTMTLQALLEQHESTQCPLRAVKCKGCGDEVSARNFSTHEQKDCSNRMVKCECGKSMRASEVAQHGNSGCAERKVECVLCGMMVRALDEEDHRVKVCQDRRVDCSKNCGKRLAARDILRHQRDECPERDVICLECDEAYQFKDAATHAARSCSARVIECVKCGANYKAFNSLNHDCRECPKRSTKCRLGCSQVLPFDLVAHHEESECAQRLVKCLFAAEGCLEVIPKHLLGAHVETCQFNHPPSSTNGDDASSSPQDAPELENRGPCTKCGGTQRGCPICDESFCVKCINLSGLPTRGLCKSCTRAQILKEKRTLSKKEIKFKF